MDKYEAELEAARARALEQREGIRRQAVMTGQSILGDAQNEAQALLQKSGRDTAQEVEAARRALRTRVDSLASRVLARVMAE